MPVRILIPATGFTPALGLYLAGLEEVRQRLREAITGLSDEQIGRRAVPEAHSIGGLVLHIGEAEWWWIQCNVSGHKLTEEDRCAPYWDVLEEPDAFASKGYSAEFCLQKLDEIREQTRVTLASFADDDLDRIFAFDRRGEIREQSLRWILHHLIVHEAQHMGQILVLKRLMGIKNAEF